MRCHKIVLLITMFCLPAISLAETAWVSDQFEITLRSGPTTGNAILLMINSGTSLEVLEQDSGSGYTRVRTSGGKEGWVVSRYLMKEMPARQRLAQLTSQLTSAKANSTSLSGQFDAIKSEQGDALRKISQLEKDNSQLASELGEIKRTAANVIAIDKDNSSLRKRLADADIKVSMLEQENDEFRSRKTRDWFIAGALVLFSGIVMGILIPKIRWQRRSGYDRF